MQHLGSRTPAIMAGLSLCSLLPSQGLTIVSPLPASATVEGTQSNSFPFFSTLISRYMQIHSDVAGSSKLITKLAFRRNGPTAPSAGTRTSDLELRMGPSLDWNTFSYVFANNYLSAPTIVLPRQIVNIGPLVATGSPAPFEIAIPLQTPFAYSGSTSLAWDITQYANTGTLGSTHDTEGGSATTGTASTITGAGCIASGQSAVMDTDLQHVDRGGVYQCGFWVKNAPILSPTVLYLGASNPNLPVLGLCGNVYTDLLVSIPLGSSNGSGYIGERGTSATTDLPSALATFLVPNTFGGAQLYAQAHALDLGRTDPLPVCNSNGRTWIVPSPTTTSIVKASRLYNFTLQGPAYPNATPLTLDHGYAAVVEFSY